MMRMMKRIVSFFFALVISAFMLSIPCFAASEKVVLLFDDNNHIGDNDTSRILSRAYEVSEITGFNIIINVCDDVGSSKSDSSVMAFADDMYDQYCGKNTNGVLLLINNDTYYDYISTSGSAINYLSDGRIKEIFKKISPSLKSEDYAGAAMSFLNCLDGYHQVGKANNQTEMLGLEVDLEEFFMVLIVMSFIPIVVTIVTYAVNAAVFKIEKPTTNNYMLKNSLYLAQNTNTFVGVVTNRTYSPRSSGSSSGGSHGSHHSSTHHSSSGGRHGGGGHHR